MLLKADGSLRSPLKKLLSVSARDELLQRTGAEPGDLLLIAAGSLSTVVRDTQTSNLDLVDHSFLISSNILWNSPGFSSGSPNVHHLHDTQLYVPVVQGCTMKQRQIKHLSILPFLSCPALSVRCWVIFACSVQTSWSLKAFQFETLQSSTSCGSWTFLFSCPKKTSRHSWSQLIIHLLLLCQRTRTSSTQSHTR